MNDAEKDITVSLAELCLKHRQAGIREVVEWIEKQPEEDCVECGYLRLIDRRDWQAQKKKWGIE